MNNKNNMRVERIRIFSNGTEYSSWMSKNCHQCKLYETKSSSLKEARCKAAFSIDYAYFDDGKVSKEYVEQIGYHTEPFFHLGNCKMKQEAESELLDEILEHLDDKKQE